MYNVSVAAFPTGECSLLLLYNGSSAPLSPLTCHIRREAYQAVPPRSDRACISILHNSLSYCKTRKHLKLRRRPRCNRCQSRSGLCVSRPIPIEFVRKMCCTFFLSLRICFEKGCSGGRYLDWTKKLYHEKSLVPNTPCIGII